MHALPMTAIMSSTPSLTLSYIDVPVKQLKPRQRGVQAGIRPSRLRQVRNITNFAQLAA